MAKICIPFSGGINSSYALWRWLSQTDHDIVASYSAETWASQEQRNQEATQAVLVVDWLKANVRDFTFETISWPSEYESEMSPLRIGFTNQMDVGVVKPRYTGYANLIQQHSPDGIVIGMSLENTAVDTYPMFKHLFETSDVDIYLAGNPVMEPVAQGDAFDWDAVATTMVGRFEQFEAMPSGLQAVVNLVDPAKEQDIWDRRWAYKNAYDAFVAAGKTGRDFDLHCAEKGNYGQWRSAADPEKQGYRGGCCDDCTIDNYLAEAAGLEWPSTVEFNKSIALLVSYGVDMTGITTDEQLGDFCGRMGRINLDRGVNSDEMQGDEYWAAIAEASKL